MRDRRSEPDPSLVDGHSPAEVCVPVVDLLASAGGRRDRQLIFGETVRVFTTVEEHAYIITDKDSYIGFVPTGALRAPTPSTHRVQALATHVYRTADIKSPDVLTLSFGSRLAAIGESPAFIQIAEGFVPKIHLNPFELLEEDPVAVTEKFLGAPYLWGGNSRLGLDCSGLIQAAFLACGRACPGDSDQQEQILGATLPADTPYQRGDLLFWKGHVALVRNETTIIHANGYHMSVVIEDIEEAISRIHRQGDGPVTSHIRPGGRKG